ncbi:MAG: hypothetical protein JOZ81_14535 [Chloroflexi bacterium]|nr:hypothetical protein [Chloroflexota bacterium]
MRLLRLPLLLLLIIAAPLPPGIGATASAPTVRLWATREGLVGRTTAAGHVIGQNDHFVALPSRSAIGKSVVITYNGKSLTAPVLDVGPWNREDAWWESGSARGRFPDLPRWVPEVWAAYENGYNGGRDATNRFVTFPSMIDLSDGVYADLGLPHADWVDVTLSWVDAPSPPPLAPADRKILKKPDPDVPTPAQAPALAHDERYFAQTGYRIDNDNIWSYFRARGQVAVFGYPVSRTFLLLGCQVQVFQRQIAQDCAGRGAGLMNVLDPDVFPYDHVNGSALPPPDPAVKAETPVVGSATYGAAIIDFVHATAPDSFEGDAVSFGKTFFGTIQDGPLSNLEVWGAPISRPRRDPANSKFVYQRFQRGIMHFDATTGLTEGLLLADYFKAIMRGRDLPPDLAGAARTSRFFGQYCTGSQHWVCRPEELPGTDLTFAFEAA